MINPETGIATCESCERDFSPRGKAGKYCSTPCRSGITQEQYDEGKTLKVKVCHGCNKEFNKPQSLTPAKWYKRKFCSAKCAKAAPEYSRQEENKRCSRCEETKNVSQFNANVRAGGYHAWCRQCSSDYNKEYRDRPGNREKDYQSTKEWKKNNPERVRVSEKRYRDGVRERLFALLGEVCKECGFSDRRALQVDHIYGVPSEDRRQKIEGKWPQSPGGFRGGVALYAAILRGERDSKEFQILCANCNWIKRHERGETCEWVREEPDFV